MSMISLETEYELLKEVFELGTTSKNVAIERICSDRKKH